MGHEQHNGNGKVSRGASLEEGIVAFAESGELAAISQEAIARQLAKGLAVTFKRGKHIVRQHPDGREEILGEVRDIPYELPAGVLPLGTP